MSSPAPVEPHREPVSGLESEDTGVSPVERSRQSAEQHPSDAAAEGEDDGYEPI